MADTDTRPYEYTFTVTREAADTFAEVEYHLQRMAEFYGEHSKEYTEAAASWSKQVNMLFARPWTTETRVSRDGVLSFYVSTSAIDFGIIWHGNRRHCTDYPACYAQINDDGTVWTYSREDPVLDHEHTLSYPLDAPQSGTWSFHS